MFCLFRQDDQLLLQNTKLPMFKRVNLRVPLRTRRALLIGLTLLAGGAERKGANRELQFFVFGQFRVRVDQYPRRSGP